MTFDPAKAVQSSDNITRDRWRITIYGPPGVGKTMCSLTASDKFVNLDTPAVLDDLLFIAADQGALDGLQERPITLPYVYDVWQHRSQTVLMSTILGQIYECAKWAVEQKGVKTVVIDTVSHIDQALATQSAQMKFPDKYARWGWVLDTTKSWFDSMAMLPVRLIYLSHSGETREEDSKAYQPAGILTDIRPAIGGKRLNLYTDSVSLEMAMLATVDPTTKKLVRWLYPTGGNGFRGKNRWQKSLSDKEPADLKALMAKIPSKKLSQGIPGK